MAPSCRSSLWASTARLVVVEVMIWRLWVFSLQLAWLEDLATAVNAATLWARYWKNSRILNFHFWLKLQSFLILQKFSIFSLLTFWWSQMNYWEGIKVKFNFWQEVLQSKSWASNLCSVQHFFNFLAKDRRVKTLI